MLVDRCNELRVHVASLRRYAMALVGNPTEADDLVQESLKRAIAYIRSGREIRNMRGYLFSILHNVRATELRKNGNGDAMLPIDDFIEHLPVAASQHSAVELKLTLEGVRKLPKEQREVLLLVCLEGLAYRETAAVLGIPLGTVMSRLARARAALNRKATGDSAVGMKMVK